MSFATLMNPMFFCKVNRSFNKRTIIFVSGGDYLFPDPESKLSKYAPKSWRSSHTHVSALEIRFKFR